MDNYLYDWEIPDPSDIAKASPEEDEIHYGLAYDLRTSLSRLKGGSKGKQCVHKNIKNWRCGDCGAFIANFRHFLDNGNSSVFFPIPYWNEIELPKDSCIYKAYSPKNSVELKEYMLFLLTASLNNKLPLDVHFLSFKLTKFLNTRDKLWQAHQVKSEQRILKFDSLFECGNLEEVNIIDPTHYLLKVRPDLNTFGTSQWFYFSVTNMEASSRVKFDIINFTKKNKLYRSGMRILIYSKQKRRRAGVGWYRGGEDITYKSNSYERKDERAHFFTLSFKYTFEYENDEVFFAYSLPYKYSDICQLIANTESELSQTKESIITTERKYLTAKDILYQRECYSRTTCGLPVYTILITSNSKDDIIPIEKRKAIIVSARIHAGETTGSYTFEGFWKFLFSISLFNIRWK